MPEIHLKHSEFIHSACGTFTMNKKRIQNFKERGNSRHIYRNELENLVFNLIWLMKILKN